MTHCSHFGVCGGCAVDDRNAIDKSSLVGAALAKAGYSDAGPVPLVAIDAGTRRRVDLGVVRQAGVIVLGLHRAGGHGAGGPEIVDMQECRVLLPQIFALLGPIRLLLRHLEALRRQGAVMINWLDAGPDILLAMDAPFTGPDKTKIIAFARAIGALRVSIAVGDDLAEPAVILAAPVIRFAGVPVEVPPGGFLQASAEGEAAIVAAVLAGLPKLTAKSRIVELFAGAGTLSFPLSQHARVEAYEGDAQAVAAHDKAIRVNNLAGRMRVTRRDLARRPLQPADMANAAALVLDPPFAGAAAQMRFIVTARVKRIIYVSCNPDALAADAAWLCRAGYRVLTAVAIDQFAYASMVESVTVFDSPKK
ncbi:MAG: methyltransferase [Acidocella sp.]|nr:methyltransferase [Acidocella sp.]